MSDVKIPLVSLKHVVPEDLEYYLEMKASQGLMLKPLGQMGLFYYEFAEQKPQKCRYVVDCTQIPKERYFPRMAEMEWEYLGKVGNCIIWRKCYEKNRPDDIVDHPYRQRYCRMLGIIFLIIMLLCLIAAIALLVGAKYEMQYGISRYRWRYIIEAALQIPFILYFGWGARKLLSFKERMPRKKASIKE